MFTEGLHSVIPVPWGVHLHVFPTAALSLMLSVNFDGAVTGVTNRVLSRCRIRFWTPFRFAGHLFVSLDTFSFRWTPFHFQGRLL
jgi:hypothetical protein